MRAEKVWVESNHQPEVVSLALPEQTWKGVSGRGSPELR
jgi:hypothetical protein